jgi:hypothetical protein
MVDRCHRRVLDPRGGGLLPDPEGASEEESVALRFPAARDLEHDIVKSFRRYLGPAVIIFVALVVGFVAIALLSAIHGMNNQVNLSAHTWLVTAA